MAKRYSSNTSGNSLMIVMIVVIVAVLALGIWAVWGTISTNVRNNQLANGAEPTVEELSDQSGMEIDEFLAQYGVADQGLDGSSLMSEMTDPMTLTNYASFMGVSLTEDDFADFKTKNEIADDVTMDTTDPDIKSQYYMYAYQKQTEEQAAEQAASEASADTADTAADTATTDTTAADATAATASTDTAAEATPAAE